MDIRNLIDRGALFVVNHSGGKDSQAMLCELVRQLVPFRQMVVVHADLGEVEWHGTMEHARMEADRVGIPFVIARAQKTLLDMVERRFENRPEVPSFPSASHRQCTSDLKRGPIEREVRRYAKAHGFKLIVNCMGIRAAESPARSKLKEWRLNELNSKAGREWYDWLPIFDMTTEQVFATIAGAGQKPHWAYDAGNERLSCVFCIMGSKRDLANGARHRPELFQRYVELETTTGYTMHMSRKSLVQLVAEGQAELELDSAA